MPRTLWKPGESGNPKGRPKGSRDKLSEQVYAEFYADWKEHGLSVVKKVRETKPEVYLQAAIRLVPAAHEVSVEDFRRSVSEFSTEELVAVIQDEIAERRSAKNGTSKPTAVSA